MKNALIVRQAPSTALALPNLISNDGGKTAERFLEFFAANIRNKNTRLAYARAVSRFLDWCEQKGASLQTIKPILVAAYIEELTKERAPQTVKQHLAAIRMLCDWLVTGQVIPMNPASSVRGPRYSIKKGKTPVLTVEEMRKLIDSIDISNIIGLRDRALIGLMVYSFGRVSAITGIKVKDHISKGRRSFIRLHEKGGKHHEVPVHHKAEEFLDAYIEAAGIVEEKNTPLFRSIGGRGRELSKDGMNRFDIYEMVRRRALALGMGGGVSPHSFRATGITAYLENGGTIEHAQQIAAHESPRTTKLYDRTNDAISLDEIERIMI